jgi:hypothetical protein
VRATLPFVTRALVLAALATAVSACAAERSQAYVVRLDLDAIAAATAARDASPGFASLTPRA